MTPERTRACSNPKCKRFRGGGLTTRECPECGAPTYTVAPEISAPSLRRQEQQPAAALPGNRSRRRGIRRPSTYALEAAGVVLALVSLAWAVLHDGSNGPKLGGGGATAATNAVRPQRATTLERFRIGAGAADLAAAGRGLWVTANTSGRIDRIDLTNRTLGAPPRAVSGGPTAVAVAPNAAEEVETGVTGGHGASATAYAPPPGRAWVALFEDDKVVQVDRQLRKVQELRVGDGPIAVAVAVRTLWTINLGDKTLTAVGKFGRKDFRVAAGPTALAPAPNGVWVGDANGRVRRFDAAGEKDEYPAVSGPVDALVVAGGRLWVTAKDSDRVTVVDPFLGGVSRGPIIGSAPHTLSVRGGVVVAGSAPNKTLTEVATETRKVLAVIRVDGEPSAVVPEGGGYWFSDYDDGTVSFVQAPRSHD